MRAVRSDGEGGVEVVDTELCPPAYATDPVTVRVTSASICGSDLKLLSWGLPVTLGHEFAGRLDDGTYVAVQPNAPCGVCAECRAGRDHLCPESAGRVLGVANDGGLADEVIVDRGDLVPLPDGVGAMPTIGWLSRSAPVEPAKRASPNEKMPPSDATRQ